MKHIIDLIQESNLISMTTWLVITYAATLGACLIDLAAGLYKAIKSGQATTSTGLRKTCTKAQHYFLPMLCLSFADFLAATLFTFPPFSMCWAAFCISCEFKSVLEKSATKEQIREATNTMGVIIKNKEDLAQALMEVMKQVEQKKANDYESRTD